jgi:hypothetical protein
LYIGRIKLSQTKTYRRRRGKIARILTLVLDVSERLTSGSSRFIVVGILYSEMELLIRGSGKNLRRHGETSKTYKLGPILSHPYLRRVSTGTDSDQVEFWRI